MFKKKIKIELTNYLEMSDNETVVKSVGLRYNRTQEILNALINLALLLLVILPKKPFPPSTEAYTKFFTASLFVVVNNLLLTDT